PPKGHAGTQWRQPWRTSCWTTTVPSSVRTIAPVGQTLRQADSVQCLHTSELMSHRNGSSPSKPSPATRSGRDCSTNATWRQLLAPSSEVLSNDSPLHTKPSSGTRFHSL